MKVTTEEDIQKSMMQLFPKKPYNTQLFIAKSLHQILNEGKIDVAIVESPTGTGKTYALLVGVLSWMLLNPILLQNENKKSTEPTNNSQQEDSLPSWLATKANQNKLAQVLQKKQEKLKKMKTIKEFKQNRTQIKVKETKKQQILEWQVQDIQDLSPGNENGRQAKGIKRINKSLNGEDPFTDDQCLPKLIFVSRTHSQLGQVMDSISNMNMEWKHLSMASKDHLCVHPNIEKSKVHEKCQYLLSHGGCPYYHQEPISDFIGARIQIAQRIGKQNSICSYFAIKNLLPLADIICLPYTSILSPEVRSRLNINIKNSIIVFDQAHNIIEQQLGIKSPEISFKDLAMFCNRIDEYKGKYGSRMAEANLSLICHIQDILRGLMSVIKVEFKKQDEKQDGPFENIYVKMTKIQLFSRLKLSQIKVHRIKNYISLSNFDQKLAHFNTKQPFPVSIVNNFLDFITVLTTNRSKTLSIQSTLILIKNLPTSGTESPLNAASVKIFTMQCTELPQIIKESRLVVLAGGTMEPLNCYTSIFKEHNLSYKFIKGEHVIKDQQCNVYCVAGIENSDKEPERLPISFTYNEMKTKSKQILESAVKIVKKIVKNAQQSSGTVIFIQNYGLLENIAQHLGHKVYEIPVYYDTGAQQARGKQKFNDNAFELYQKQIREKKKSAILVSVMGGRLSEGINFSDQLARNIIVLGLPYPNLKSPQMIQKMGYLDRKLKLKFQIQKQNNNFATFESANKKFKKDKQTETQQTGQSYYQNCCIKIINQTIGRGIRHKNDYANIYLIDLRFAGIRHRLPSWMSKRVHFIDFYPC